MIEMSFDDFGLLIMLGCSLAVFYAGIYKFGVFYHTRQIEKAREEFKENLHKPHFFGDGQ
jgi:hypothetical protein